MAQVIHFTHHLCRMADPHAEHPHRGLPMYCDERREYEQRFGPGAESSEPSWTSGCGCVFGKTPRFTSDAKLVTCKSCVRGFRLRHREAQLVVGDGELVKRAWLLCCSKRGAACPLNRVELAAVEALRRERSIKPLTRLGDEISIAALSDKSIASHLRSEVAAIVGDLDDDVRDAAQLLINEWLLAADLAEVLDERLSRAQVLADELRDRIAPGLVVDRPHPKARAIDAAIAMHLAEAA